MFDGIAKSAQSAARRLRVRSALNPMLWLTGIATPLCLGAAFAFGEVPIIQWVLVAVGLLPVVTTCLGFAYFAITKPDKLQSEDYQLRHESLQLLQTKSGHTAIDPTAVSAIANPILQALPASKEEAE